MLVAILHTIPKNEGTDIIVSEFIKKMDDFH